MIIISKLGLILFVSAIATISVASGLNRGIKLLSEINIWLCIILLSFIIFAGPTLTILSSLVSGTLDYFATLLPMSIWVDPNEEIIIVLLANRVHPSRKEEKGSKEMYGIRRDFYNRGMEVLIKAVEE